MIGVGLLLQLALVVCKTTAPWETGSCDCDATNKRAKHGTQMMRLAIRADLVVTFCVCRCTFTYLWRVIDPAGAVQTRASVICC